MWVASFFSALPFVCNTVERLALVASENCEEPVTWIKCHTKGPMLNPFRLSEAWRMCVLSRLCRQLLCGQRKLTATTVTMERVKRPAKQHLRKDEKRDDGEWTDISIIQGIWVGSGFVRFSWCTNIHIYIYIALHYIEATTKQKNNLGIVILFGYTTLCCVHYEVLDHSHICFDITIEYEISYMYRYSWLHNAKCSGNISRTTHSHSQRVSPYSVLSHKIFKFFYIF